MPLRVNLEGFGKAENDLSPSFSALQDFLEGFPECGLHRMLLLTTALTSRRQSYFRALISLDETCRMWEHSCHSVDREIEPERGSHIFCEGPTMHSLPRYG